MKNKKFKVNKEHFRVAIFGSARIDKNDENYKLIYDLARRIGAKNMDIVTGGGPGTMEAANSGHKEGSKGLGYSWGLLIKLPREQKSNKHLDISKEFHIFSNRLDNFMALSDVLVVAPGGIGTMLELFYAWQLIQVKHICNIPIILLGEQWKHLIEWMNKWMLKNKYINKDDLNYVFLARNSDEAMEIINKTHDDYLNSSKKVCINMKKYGVLKKFE